MVTMMIFVTSFISYQYYVQKSFLYKCIDDKLRNAVYSGIELVGDELHNYKNTEKNISKKENIKNSLILSTLTNHNDVEYVYTLIKKKDKVYFTCSSVTIKEKNDKSYIKYITEYKGATDKLKESFTNHKTYFGEVTDEYGTFRSIIMPQLSPSGIWYLIGADIEISDINDKLNNILIKYLIAFIIFVLILFLFMRKLLVIIKKENKDQLSQQKAILNQTKFTQMGEVIGNISHQWRQPLSELNSIIMKIDIDFKHKKLTDNNLEQYLVNIERLTEYMSSTIDDFNDYYKKDKIKESFIISKAIEKAVLLCENNFLKYSIKIELDIVQNIQYNGLKNEFIQVILAILNNAKDALISKKIDIPIVQIKVIKKDDKIMITIHDNAGGINQENIEKIFDPYFTTKFKSNGVGIGLYMSKSIIQKNMNGNLTVENKELKDSNQVSYLGAEFKIIL